MEPMVQQSLTIIFGTVAPILLVGGGAFAWLRSDIHRVEKKSEDAHKDIRNELKEVRGELGDLKQSHAKMQAEIHCLNDKVDSIDRRLDKPNNR